MFLRLGTALSNVRTPRCKPRLSVRLEAYAPRHRIFTSTWTDCFVLQPDVFFSVLLENIVPKVRTVCCAFALGLLTAHAHTYLRSRSLRRSLRNTFPPLDRPLHMPNSPESRREPFPAERTLARWNHAPYRVPFPVSTNPMHRHSLSCPRELTGSAVIPYKATSHQVFLPVTMLPSPFLFPYRIFLFPSPARP